MAIDPHLKVQIAHLDHLIPTLAFALQERFHINIHKDRLEGRAGIVGPWLQELKAAIWREEEEDFSLLVPFRKGGTIQQEKVTLKTLKGFLTISPGQKIAYVTDCRFTEENVEKISALAWEADMFFLRSGIFGKRSRPGRGEEPTLPPARLDNWARLAKVKKLQIFHFSPKYEKEPMFFGKRKKPFRKIEKRDVRNGLGKTPAPVTAVNETHPSRTHRPLFHPCPNIGFADQGDPNESPDLEGIRVFKGHLALVGFSLRAGL